MMVVSYAMTWWHILTIQERKALFWRYYKGQSLAPITIAQIVHMYKNEWGKLFVREQVLADSN